MQVTINAVGHENVTAAHKTTLEITKENHLTPRGDCIIAIGADKSMLDFGKEFMGRLRDDEVKMVMMLECGDVVDEVVAKGDSRLILSNPTDIVVRKSEFICDRTLAVHSNKAACDLNPDLIKKLKSGLPVEVKIILM